MSELKPCPFCGSEADIITGESLHGERLYGVMCNCCTGRTDLFDTEDGAVDSWNSRVERTCSMKQKYECQYDDIECSECGAALWAFTMDLGRDGIVVTPNYCPNCGALVI